MTFRELLRRLESFWADHGCLLLVPWDVEVGAGTMHPATFLRSLGPEPFRAAYVQPCRRPADSRYARNPMRVQHYYQFQVILKPPPADVQELCVASLGALGIPLAEHDLRFHEDDWESPTLGAAGVGWQVDLDGNEIAQFTYFQTMGGSECRPVTVEITYGSERLACLLQGVSSFWELEWDHGITYGELERQAEIENSVYNLELADTAWLTEQFARHEAEAQRLVARGLVYPAYDHTLRCSHTLNLLEARGTLSVTERAQAIARVRALAQRVAQLYLQQREEAEFPLLPGASTAVAAT